MLDPLGSHVFVQPLTMLRANKLLGSKNFGLTIRRSNGSLPGLHMKVRFIATKVPRESQHA